jgi:hypothetical protein
MPIQSTMPIAQQQIVHVALLSYRLLPRSADVSSDVLASDRFLEGREWRHLAQFQLGDPSPPLWRQPLYLQYCTVLYTVHSTVLNIQYVYLPSPARCTVQNLVPDVVLPCLRGNGTLQSGDLQSKRHEIKSAFSGCSKERRVRSLTPLSIIVSSDKHSLIKLILINKDGCICITRKWWRKRVSQQQNRTRLDHD